MAATASLPRRRLDHKAAALLLAACGGCSTWTTTPQSTQQLTDFKETVKSVSGQGDMAGVDPRARQIERNLGVSK